MGFFSDLKEDLSQAVNELMPDENVEESDVTETADVVESNETVADDAETVEAAVEEAGGDSFDAELEKMLSELDEEEKVEEVADEDMSELLDTIAVSEPVKETKGERKMDVQFAHNVVDDETSVITKGMTINGDIVSQGSVDVLGCINGNIDILGKLNVTGAINGDSKAAEVFADNAKIVGEVVSDGSVKVGQSSVIIGNITATSAVIAGAVKGDIDVQGPVILDASAIVMGNIKSKSVQINNGAVIEGMCSQCYADVSPTSFFEVFKEGKK
ncbi:MAG: polymer-forming cytoskeletal protein [Lachnospiraceae bacterium]|nr:polymer-forming cytoskeletal protein [Lachnospiraceae bacterium]